MNINILKWIIILKRDVLLHHKPIYSDLSRIKKTKLSPNRVIVCFFNKVLLYHTFWDTTGKLSVSEKEIESEPLFCKTRHRHSAIESNINELEHRGLNCCKDKKQEGFERYVGIGVIAYNLKRIGEYLLDKDRQPRKESA